jgi:hypothetical protein
MPVAAEHGLRITFLDVSQKHKNEETHPLIITVLVLIFILIIVCGAHRPNLLQDESIDL